jgi:hypothetical protein
MTTISGEKSLKVGEVVAQQRYIAMSRMKGDTEEQSKTVA